ncbi:hypothetical protein T10_2423 [Trichinella papuae]|uniref:Uncharacterized protein n=1 Tax=Trichinella papuae TaxID=268474 RepID=A0A0V1N7R1_9BILA|nr:hypothetical protein T10_2423 [Trichinella papuae]
MGHAVLVNSSTHPNAKQAPLFYGTVKPRTTVFLKQRIVSLQLPKFAMSVEYSEWQTLVKILFGYLPPSNAAFQH